jgi:hypothetical protein
MQYGLQSYKYLLIKTIGIIHRAKQSTFKYCHRQLKTKCTAVTLTSKQWAVKDI